MASVVAHASLAMLALRSRSPPSLSPPPPPAKLSPAETRMIQTVDAEQERTLAMLEKWVNQNSGSLNLAGVTKVGEMLRAELEPLGFTVEWIDMRADRPRRPYRRHPQGQRPRQAAAADRPSRHGVRARQPVPALGPAAATTATGPGAGDDKGGMAVMVAALRAMQAAGTLKDADIEIVLTGDEEDTGNPIEIARRDLIAAGKRADVALDFEGLAQEDGKRHGLDRPAQLGRLDADRHRPRPAIRAASSRAGAGYGAIYELARILDAFRRELPEPNLTFNVGLVGGGATAELDAGPDPRSTATGKTNIIAADRHRPRRPARASPRADRAGARRRCRRSSPQPLPGADGRDRLRRRRLSADGADRGQPRAARPAQRGQPRPRPAPRWASSTR